MYARCEDCGTGFDDASSFPFCPHEEFLTEEEASQHDASMALLGRRVRLRGELKAAVHRVVYVNGSGTVGLSGIPGEYRPESLELVNTRSTP